MHSQGATLTCEHTAVASMAYALVTKRARDLQGGASDAQLSVRGNHLTLHAVDCPRRDHTHVGTSTPSCPSSNQEYKTSATHISGVPVGQTLSCCVHNNVHKSRESLRSLWHAAMQRKQIKAGAHLLACPSALTAAELGSEGSAQH
jgi:hypothetical protein